MIIIIIIILIIIIIIIIMSIPSDRNIALKEMEKTGKYKDLKYRECGR